MMGTYVMKELKHIRSQALINILHIEKAGLNFFYTIPQCLKHVTSFSYIFRDIATRDEKKSS